MWYSNLPVICLAGLSCLTGPAFGDNGEEEVVLSHTTLDRYWKNPNHYDRFSAPFSHVTQRPIISNDAFRTAHHAGIIPDMPLVADTAEAPAPEPANTLPARRPVDGPSETSYWCIPSDVWRAYCQPIQNLLDRQNFTEHEREIAILHGVQMFNQDTGRWDCVHAELWSGYGAREMWNREADIHVKHTVVEAFLDPDQPGKGDRKGFVRRADSKLLNDHPQTGPQQEHGPPQEHPPSQHNFPQQNQPQQNQPQQNHPQQNGPQQNGPQQNGPQHNGPCGPNCGCQKQQCQQPAVITQTTTVTVPSRCGCGNCDKKQGNGHGLMLVHDNGQGTVTVHDNAQATVTSTKTVHGNVQAGPATTTTTVYDHGSSHQDTLPDAPYFDPAQCPKAETIVFTKETVSLFFTTTTTQSVLSYYPHFVGNWTTTVISTTSVPVPVPVPAPVSTTTKTLPPQTVTDLRVVTQAASTTTQTVQVSVMLTQQQHQQNGPVSTKTAWLPRSGMETTEKRVTITSYIEKAAPSKYTETRTVTAGAVRVRGENRAVALLVGVLGFWGLWMGV